MIAAMASGAPLEIIVEKAYKRFDHAALQDVNLTIARGEIVAVIGWAGSGKTVLLRMITGLCQPERGRVLVADHESEGSPLRDLATLNEREMDRIRAHWALVFQGNAPLSGSVFENLAVLPRELRRNTEIQLLPLARKILTDVGLEPEAVLQLDCAMMSAGMAKLVAIARALMMDPVLIMYDNPTAGLDPEAAWRIHEVIARTHAGMPALGVARTTLVATHDTELLRHVRPRIVMLHEGRVVFDGSFETFTNSADARVRPYLQQMSLLNAHSPTPGH